MEPYRSTTWFPSLGLIYAPNKSITVRANYSQTEGRPSLREIGTFFNRSVESGNLVAGNAALVPSAVTNFDLRVEWNRARTDSFSISAFRKEIENPIEKYLIDTRAVATFRTESWVNTPGEALVSGIEVEFRHSLSTWSELLSGMSIGGNYTWIDAETTEHPAAIANATQAFQDPAEIPASRRLYDQPDYIANLDWSWSNPRTGTTATLAAYAIGDVLSTAGLWSFRFDSYERAYVRLDLIVSQRLTQWLKVKLAVKNLNDPTRGEIYDRDRLSTLTVLDEYKAGRDFSISFTAEF